MTGGGGVGGAQDHLKAFRSSQLGPRRRPARLGPFRGDPGHLDVEQLDEPAAWWCGTCGYLLPPQARDVAMLDGDPMRREPTAPPTDPHCPHCGDPAWIDFGVVPLAMRVRDEEGVTRSRQRRRGARMLGALALTAGLMGVITVIGVGVEAILAPLLPLAGAFAVGDRRLPPRPYRWHRPVREWEAGRSIARGVARGHELIAPLSGRRAIAWLIGVREGGRKPDRRVFDPTSNDWMLIEQRCSALSIAGEPLGVEPVLDLRPQRLTTAVRGADTWLRTRGLEPLDVQIFEAILTAGDEVELLADADDRTTILRLVSETAIQAEATGLPPRSCR